MDIPSSGKARITKWDIWALGITIVIGGQYFGWNSGLSAGVGSFSIALILTGSAYICICMCASEITSALPAAGGNYSFARCSLGFFPGFVIGCSDIIRYIFYVSCAVVSLADMITMMYPSVENYEPVIHLLFFLSALSIHIFSGQYFWKFNFGCAAVAITILVIFILGSTPYVNINRYAANSRMPQTLDNKWFTSGGDGFLRMYPLPAWFFVGVEVLNMASEDVTEPGKTIPFAQQASMATLAVFATAVYIVTIGLPPGINEIAVSETPLNYGFNLMFKTSSLYLSWLSIPAIYATAFGFMYAYGKVLEAMAGSKLFPTWLETKYPSTGSPLAALLVCSALSYVVCIASFYNNFFFKALFNIGMLNAFISYAGLTLSYLFFYNRLHHFQYSYKSPLGLYGAIYSLPLWLLGIVSVTGYQEDEHLTAYIELSLLCIFTIYYNSYCTRYQTFSEDERKIMFKAHVIKNNLAKRRNLKKGAIVPQSNNASIRTPSNHCPKTGKRFHSVAAQQLGTFLKSLGVKTELASGNSSVGSGSRESSSKVNHECTVAKAAGKLQQFASVIPTDLNDHV